MQQIPFIDLFKSAVHVSCDKLAHPQEHVLTAFGTIHCTDIAADRCIVLYQKLYIYSQKVLLRMGEFFAWNM